LVAFGTADSRAPREFPQLRGCPAIQASKAGIEPANAAESGGESRLCEREIGLVDEGLGEVQPACLNNGDWSGSKVLQKQAAELARSDAQARGEIFQRRVSEAVLFNQA